LDRAEKQAVHIKLTNIYQKHIIILCNTIFYKEVKNMLTTLMALIDEPSDKEKFEKLYWAYRSKMYYQAYSVLKNRSLAEEAV